MSRILSISLDANVHLYRKPVRMGLSFDGLALLVRTELNKDMAQGDLFFFLNRKRTMLKLLVYENKGFSIFYRRLDNGSFIVPVITGEAATYQMTVDQVFYMLNGMTLQQAGYVTAEKYEELHGIAV